MEVTDIADDNMNRARREYEEIQLDDIAENPRYDTWNKLLLNNLYKISKKGNNESKKKADILILGYIDWCKINNKDIFNPSGTNIIENQIIPLDNMREIRELIQLQRYSTIMNVRKRYFLCWITMGILFVIATLTFGLLH
jgi:hypothetical protein